ncbi:MAG: hypothetical protein JWN33_606 [Candidatus Saccharibacteria bacterium]|nr:hypothetical protein [Candidatus Saccharibacteria bacterium]
MVIIGYIAAGIVLLFGFVTFRGAPYLPSKKKQLKQAFDGLYALGKSDTLVDIGSGDGIVLRTARQYGAKAIGYELNPLLVLITRLMSWKDKKLSVRLADFWRVQLPHETTLVYVFPVERDQKKLTRKLEAEATRLGRSLMVLVYAHRLIGHEPEKQLGAYSLYRIQPLQ